MRSGSPGHSIHVLSAPVTAVAHHRSSPSDSSLVRSLLLPSAVPPTSSPLVPWSLTLLDINTARCPWATSSWAPSAPPRPGAAELALSRER
eukprot:3387959-Pyramimonas_sp.AAC.1